MRPAFGQTFAVFAPYLRVRVQVRQDRRDRDALHDLAEVPHQFTTVM